MADINGTDGSDQLTGTAGADTIHGLGGDDAIQGDLGDDNLFGDDGDDYLSDNAGGSDRLNGGAGNDFLLVSRVGSPAAALEFNGGDGADRIYYYAYTSANSLLNIAITGDILTVDAGAGNDLIALTRFAAATIDAGSGDDYVQIDQSSIDAAITLGTGQDILEIKAIGYPIVAGTRTVTDFLAGAGGDRIYLTFDSDGYANDRFAANPFATGHLLLVQNGADTLLQLDDDGAAGSNAPVTMLVLQGVQASSLTYHNFGFAPDGSAVPASTLTGTAGADQLIGFSGNDTINGLGGDDLLMGSVGNDTLDGGDGNDTLNGGRGDDVLDGGGGDDRLNSFDPGGTETLRGGAGSDYISVSYFSGTHTGTLTLDGGDDGDFISYFNFGYEVDRLSVLGGDGIDYINISINDQAVIDAGGGDDLVYVDFQGGPTTLTLGAGADTVVVRASQWGTHDVGVESYLLITDFDYGVGGDRLVIDGVLDRYMASTSLLYGNPILGGVLRIATSGVDTLLQVNRDGGADSWVTFARLMGVSASSVPTAALGIFGTAQADTVDLSLQGINHYYAGSGNDIVYGGFEADILAGEAGDDQLDGGANADVLSGGRGADQLVGGAGSDTLIGGLGRDVFQGTVAEFSGDRIADFRVLDTIRIADANLAAFSFARSGDTLSFGDVTVTVDGLAGLRIAARAAAAGGVELYSSGAQTLFDNSGDARADLLWMNSDGVVAEWTSQGSAFTGGPSGLAAADWNIAGRTDLNGDGRADLVWRHTGGTVAAWLSSGSGWDSAMTGISGTDWSIAGTGDFNGDGLGDVLWRHSGGAVAIWNSDGTNFTGGASSFAGTDWSIVSTGDFDGDGNCDILWRHSSGTFAEWLSTGTAFASGTAGFRDTSWTLAGTGDFDGDGKSDLIWRSTSGAFEEWYSRGASFATGVTGSAATSWQIEDIADYNGDGRADLMWRNTDGTVTEWLTGDTGFTQGFLGFAANDWHLV